MAEFTYFARFPAFKYDPNAPVSSEFKRLGRYRHWKPGSKTWCREWNHCMSDRYDLLIGNRVCNLETWQKMCQKLEIPGTLTSIRQCRKALSQVYVNLVDLLDCWDSPESPRRFRSCKELANYTIDRHKLFSRDIGKQDKALRVLLKKLH